MSHTPNFSISIQQEGLIKELARKPHMNPHVLNCFRTIPRHLFVDAGFQHQAYIDKTLPIGEGQTISQPSIVALMTSLLDLNKPDLKILEIGTGSGFQTAVLSCFTKRLFTIERFANLSAKAQARLNNLGIVNVAYKVGDGTMGWSNHGPYDRIIVTAGAPSVPQTLLRQLAPEGKLLIPTGDRDSQHLELYHLRENQIERQRFENVLFVPLVGAKGWQE